MKLTPERTIGSVVAEDQRAATTLTRHGIDFCCKGGRTVEEVCRTKGLDPAVLEQEIRADLARDTRANEDFRNWTLQRLVEHIEQVHHSYVQTRTPIIQQYLAKLGKVHGERHPELFQIAEEFDACAHAMAAHMKKEELMLFPYIVKLEKAHNAGTAVDAPHFGTVNDPVRMMMNEHDAEGERFRRIVELSYGYALPPDGCATYSAAMIALKEFETDLQQHIHLENNILFPRAVELELSMAV